MDRPPAGAGAAGERQPLALVEAGLAEHLHLDHMDGHRWALTNVVSGEQRILPEKQTWQLVADAENDVVLVGHNDGEEPDIVEIGTVLRTRIMQTADGHFYLWDSHSPSSAPAALQDEACKLRRGRCRLPVVGTGVGFELQCVVFVRPRPGNVRVFFNLNEVHEFLQVESFNRCRSTWIYRSRAAWQKAFVKLIGGAGHAQFVHSVSNTFEDSLKGKLAVGERCAPWSCMSLLGLLAQTVRWQVLSRERGGFASESVRNSAGLLARAMLSALQVGGDPLVVKLHICSNWTCQWPRPNLVPEDSSLRLQIDNGKVALAPLRAAAAAVGRGNIAARWLAAFANTPAEQEDMEIIGFLVCVASTPATQALFAQMIWAISQELERLFGGMAQGKIAPSAGVASFEWMTVSDLVESDGMEAFLVQYVANCNESFERECPDWVFSVATDKGQCNALPLQDTIVALPSNRAWLCTPVVARLNLEEVDRAYDAEKIGDDEPRPERKRKAAVMEGRANSQLREKAWLSRYTGGARPGSWRPLARHRGAAKRWAENIDSQLRYCTTCGGLAAFRRNPEDERWQNWRRWPHLTVAMDLGSDGLCSFHWCEYGPHRLNVDKIPDWSHGANRCMITSMQDTGLFTLMLVMLMSWNLPFGPGPDEHLRFLQLRQSLQSFLARSDAAVSPLFLHYCPRLVRCFERNGHRFDNTKRLEEQVLEKLASRKGFVKTGSRIVLNRFCGLIAGAQLNTPWWECDEFERTMCALQCDFLRGKSFLERLRIRPGPAQLVGEDGGPTAEKRLTIEDRSSLKSACQNACVVSVCVLGDVMNRRLCEAVLVVAGPLKAWHSDQNRRNRSSSDCLDFIVEQVGGGYFVHARSIINFVSCARSLEQLGLGLCAGGNMCDDDIGMEDEFAALVCLFGLTLMKNRLRRGFWMQGWPYRFFAYLTDDVSARQVLGDFRRDLGLFRDLSGWPAPGPKIRDIICRHTMQKTSAQQLVVACEDLQFRPHPDLTLLLQKRGQGILATQACEDVVGAQKNNRSVMSKRFRRPEWSFAAALQAQILDNRHRFNMQTVDRSCMAKSSRLPPEAFHTDRAERSLDFSVIQGKNAAPDWYSPSATNDTVPAADLYAIKAASDADNFGLLESCWMGRLIDVSHGFVFAMPHSPDRWLYGLVAFDNSAVLAWPCVRRLAPDGESVWFELDLNAAKPEVELVADLHTVRAWGVQWLSPAGQVKRFGPPTEQFPPALRAFSVGRADTLVRHAASKAFWKLSRTFLTQVAEALKINLTGCDTLCSTLFTMIKSILAPISDSEVFDCLSTRLASVEGMDTMHAAALLEMDEAKELLERSDRQRVDQEQKEVCHEAENHTNFIREFRQRKSEHLFALAQAKAKAKGKAKAKANREPKPTLSPTLSQAEAKLLLPPPPSSIWASYTRGTWCGHIPPFRRISTPWCMYGCDKLALQDLLVRLWAQHFERSGDSKDSCSFDFDEAVKRLRELDSNACAGVSGAASSSG